MSSSRARKLENRKRRIAHRLRKREWEPQDRPMFTASNIHYELADKTRGLGPGGIGAKALEMPVDNLVSNWAYLVMGSLAWTLKAWFGLNLSGTGRWAEKHKTEKESVLKMEFKRFVNAFVRVPCQIVRQAGRVVYRLLAWNPWQHVFLRAVDALRGPMRC